MHIVKLTFPPSESDSQTSDDSDEATKEGKELVNAALEFMVSLCWRSVRMDAHWTAGMVRSMGNCQKKLDFRAHCSRILCKTMNRVVMY